MNLNLGRLLLHAPRDEYNTHAHVDTPPHTHAHIDTHTHTHAHAHAYTRESQDYLVKRTEWFLLRAH